MFGLFGFSSLHLPGLLPAYFPQVGAHYKSENFLTNFYIDLPESAGSEDASRWHVVPAPGRRASAAALRAFHAAMLLPGLSLGFHAATLGRSRAAIATYRAAAEQAAHDQADIGTIVRAQLAQLGPEDGLEMARQRGTAQLPHWSRLAIRHFRKQGVNRQDLSEAFCCSRGTIANVLSGKGKGYRPLSGERILTAVQQSPPGQYERTVRYSDDRQVVI